MVQMRSGSARRSVDTARAAVMALELVGFPAAIVGRNGEAIALNARLEGLNAEVIRERKGCLQLVNGRADALLTEALASLAGGEDRGAWPIPIPASGVQPPMIVHIISVRGIARDLIPDALALLVVMPVFGSAVPAAAVIQGLFDMTPAEARVARAAAQGQAIAEIAVGLGVSRETVRSQLKAALAKAGRARNIDLAAALAGAGSLMNVDND
jgi:DNA-binding CsgD family transcriptional regulator